MTELAQQLRAERAALSSAGDPPVPGWWEERREQALATLIARGWPTSAEEDWKYTNVAPLLQRGLARAPAPPLTTPPAWATRDGLPEAITLVFVDGHCLGPASGAADLPNGVRVCSLRQALAEDHPALRAQLAQQPALAAQPLAAWSTALARDGAFVYLPQGVVLARPVQLLCLTTRGAAERVVQLRSLLIAEPTSELAVIESHAAAPDAADVACLVNSATELVVGANASVAHYLLQRAGQAATQLATVQATQHADSRLTSLTCVLGGALVRNTIGTRLAAPGAQSTLDGLFFAGGRQHVDNHTTIDHEQPRCASSECYKGILDGAATGVFNGKVLVRPQAQQTDARQSNHNLLLSATATVNSKPQLEIFADDVKCSHGATIGQLDAEALFYLRARGIDEGAARSLLTWAFASEVIERVPFAALRRQLASTVQQRLGLSGLTTT
ncbi:MAG: Fe-S cluster assembly protein SufD [Proteobacteria bacterium]|nr:Fe-S cluster assembly protein SufD [Pseudomonadota bacterium]